MVVDCSSNFRSERQKIIDFCKKNNYDFKKSCKIYRRSNWGMNLGGIIDYFSYLRSIENKPEYIWQFQEHFLDLTSPWSWWGDNVYNIDGKDFSGQIKADTIPDDCFIDLNYCEKVYCDCAAVSVVFATRKDIGIFKYSDDEWFYTDGANFSARTSNILKHFTKTLLNSYKMLYDESYNYAIFCKFNICYHLSKNKQAWHDLVRKETFYSPTDLKLKESVSKTSYHQNAEKEYIPLYDYYSNKLCLLNSYNILSKKYQLLKFIIKRFYRNKFINLCRMKDMTYSNFIKPGRYSYLKKIYQRLFHKADPIYSSSATQNGLHAKEYGLFGSYPSWEEAEKQSTGYDSEIILEKVKNASLKVKRGEAVYERDSVLFDKIQYSWPLLSGLLWIASMNENRLNLIDFGGSLGTSYYQNRKFLKHLKALTWNMMLSLPLVEVGRTLFPIY